MNNSSKKCRTAIIILTQLLLKNYIPTEEAIKENRNRISLRLKKAAQRKG